MDISEIITKLDGLLPQLSEFIGQFNTILTANSINVITEVNGDMSIDVPSVMTEAKTEELSKKIGILDNLIKIRCENIDSLVNKGLEIETKLREQNNEYSSQILSRAREFERLKNSYIH